MIGDLILLDKEVLYIVVAAVEPSKEELSNQHVSGDVMKILEFSSSKVCWELWGDSIREDNTILEAAKSK